MHSRNHKSSDNDLVRSILGDLRGSGDWRRVRCPLPACDGEKQRNLAVNSEGGWRCHRCSATGRVRDVEPVARGHERKKSDTERRRNALDLFESAGPIPAGSVADEYLRHARHLVPPGGGGWPPDLHYLRATYHRWSHNMYPAIIAGARDREGVLSGIIVTYLDPDGTDKADVQPQRMMLGLLRGCAIRLGSDTTRLVVAEGFETALAAAMLFPGLTPWAAGSAAGIASLLLPPLLSELLVVADHDRSETGLAAARKLCARVANARCRVRIVMPSSVGLDANDLVASTRDAEEQT